MDIVVLVIVVVIVILIVVFAVVRNWLRNTARTRADALRSRFPNARQIVPGANFFGQQTKPGIRGNGTLVLTDKEVIFELWIPKREYIVRYSDIHSVETVNSHMGKSVMQPLLKINFTNVSGTTDSMAWWLPNLSATKSALEAAIAA